MMEDNITSLIFIRFFYEFHKIHWQSRYISKVKINLAKVGVSLVVVSYTKLKKSGSDAHYILFLQLVKIIIKILCFIPIEKQCYATYFSELM